MAALCPPIKIQEFDDNGDPAVGWKLYTYDTLTTTNKATYTDAAGAVPNTNPVILDARGEATIYLTPNTSYRMVLKTAADVTKKDVDPVLTETNTAGDGIVVANGQISLNSSVAGSGIAILGGVLSIGGGTGIVVDANNVNIDEASAANAYGFSNSAKVMTSRRMRDVFYAGLVGNTSTTPDFTSRSDNATSWTIVRNSVGNYTITHGLALSGGGNNMVIIPTSTNAGGQEIEQIARTANTFTIVTRDSAGTLDDANFGFICMRFGA